MPKVECKYDYIPSYMTGRFHSFAHVIIPLSNMLYLRINETDYWINSNQIAYVPTNTFHRLICTEKVIWFNIPIEMVIVKQEEYLSENPIYNIPEQIIPLISLIKHECKEDTENNDCLRHLFYYLYSKMMTRHTLRSIQYIESQYAENITIAKLAGIENYNINYYVGWFKRKTGYTPAQYLNKTRVDKAKELLVNTHYRVLDIALQTGYTSSSAFARAFKAIEGISPLKYRQENQMIIKYSQMPYWQTD